MRHQQPVSQSTVAVLVERWTVGVRPVRRLSADGHTWLLGRRNTLHGYATAALDAATVVVVARW